MTPSLSQRTILKVFITALALSSTAFAQQRQHEAEYAGLVSDVRGACWLMSGKVQTKITVRKSGAKRLRVGDKVRCDQGGSLVLELISSKAPLPASACSGCTTIEPSGEWTTIRRASGLREDTMAGPVDAWFKLGGALRKPPAAVYSPPSGGNASAVWPERFVIRWIPGSNAGVLSLSIQNEAGKKLWPQQERMTVPSAAGELISEEARLALLNYRKNGREGPFTLVLVDPNGNQSDAQFSVISTRQEEELKNQLMMCGKEPGLMPYICRAYYFRQINLYTEAAEEYDEALKLAPDSVDLQLHAIVAHRLTGNYKREQELVRQLPPGTKPPE